MATSEELDRLSEAMSISALVLTRPRIHELVIKEAGLRMERTGQQILAVLTNNESPMRVSAIADAVHVEGPHATRQVQRLEADGFVRRVADPDDRRASLITITPEGASAVRRLRSTVAGWMGQALAGWDEADVAELARLMERMSLDWAAFIRDKDTANRSAAGHR
jgi:DNA-binding MarR family transcriptional regulator